MMPMLLPGPDEAERAFLADCIGADRLDLFLALCMRFGEMLYETNDGLNLTAIPPEFYWSKHVCDCVLALRVLPDLFVQNAVIADVGCGAGLPAFPLAAARPDLTVEAIESRGKKVSFLERVVSESGVKNLHPVHARANELAAQEKYRRNFRVVTARAVSGAPELMKECRNLLAPNGTLCIFRTESQADEEQAILSENKKVTVSRSASVSLPHDTGTRLFLCLRPETPEK